MGQTGRIVLGGAGLPALLGALLLVMSGCAGTVRQASREAAPPAVYNSLRAANDPRGVAMINQLMHQPGVQKATHDMGVGIADGMIMGLTEEQRAARIRRIAKSYATELTSSLGQSMGRDLSPAVRQLTAAAVDSSLHQALSESNRADAARLATEITRATVSALANELHSSAGPALRDSMREQVGPAIADALGPEFRDALGESARRAAREAVIGAQQGLSEYQSQTPGAPSPLARLEGTASKGLKIVQWVAILLTLAVVILGMWLYKLIMQARRRSAEAKRREAALLVLARAIRATEGRPGARELLDEIQQQLHGSEEAEYLRRMLQTDPDLGTRPSMHH